MKPERLMVCRLHIKTYSLIHIYIILRLRPCRRPLLVAAGGLAGGGWLLTFAFVLGVVLQHIEALFAYFRSLWAHFGGPWAHHGHLPATLGILGLHFDDFGLHLGCLGGSLGIPWAHLGGPWLHFRVPWASKAQPKWSRMAFR